MRFDLTSDTAVDLAYAKINLEMGAERARNALLHPSARADRVDAYGEALRFIDARGAMAPGPWITAEQEAHNHTITAETAADLIVQAHQKWQEKAARIHMILRAAELKLRDAQTPNEIHLIVAQVEWPAGDDS
jgi:hypothetical protein